MESVRGAENKCSILKNEDPFDRSEINEDKKIFGGTVAFFDGGMYVGMWEGCI